MGRGCEELKYKVKVRSGKSFRHMCRSVKRCPRKRITPPDIGLLFGGTLSAEITGGLNQVLDSGIQQLVQEDAATAAQIEANAETVDDLDMDATGIGPEEMQLLSQVPGLLLQMAPPPFTTINIGNGAAPPQVVSPQPFNFLVVNDDDDDDDDDDAPPPPPAAPPEIVTQRLILAEFQIPQFKLGFISLAKPIKIPAQSKTFTIPAIRKTLSIPGVSASVGNRFGRISLSIPGISKTFSIGPYRKKVTIGPINKTIPTTIPSLEIADSTQVLYVDLKYPAISGAKDVKAIVNACFQEAKDAAVQQLLIYVAFAASSGGASLVVAFQQAFQAFQQTFTDCLKDKIENLSIDIAGPGLDTKNMGPFKPFYLYFK